MGKKSTPTQQDLDLGKRIVDMRKRMGYTQADLATRMRVTTPTISGYETGQADPKSGGLVQLARILSCSTDYLLGLTSNPNPTAASPISDDSFETARRVDLLDDRGKGAVKALLDYEEQIRRHQDVDVIPIRVYQNAASAGTGNYLDDDCYDTVDIPADSVPAGTEYGVSISGDSMEPDIPDGSIVFVQPSQRIASGEVGIFVLNGDSYCKRLVIDGRSVKLHSLNPAYEDIVISREDTLYTNGRVLGAWKP